MRAVPAARVRSAFTLVELLVVLAIISMLMAVLLPSLQRARRRAKATVCLAGLKQWGTGFLLYAQDHDGRLPAVPAEGIWLLRGTSAGASGPNEPRARLNLDTKGIACCPMAPRPARRPGAFAAGADGNSVPVQGASGRVFDAWEITSPGTPFRGSYGLSQSLFEPQQEVVAGEPNSTEPASPSRSSAPLPPPPPPRRSPLPPPHRRVARPSTHPDTEPAQKPPVREMNVFTARGTANMPLLLDSTVPIHFPGGDGVPPPRSGDGRVAGGMGAFCIDRHDSHVNVLFLDWSVRRVGLKELWTLKWNSGWNTAGHWTKAGGAKPEDWPRWIRHLKDY